MTQTPTNRLATLDTGRSPARIWTIAALIAICTVAAFWPATSAGFLNWDDDFLLLDNPNWRGLSPSHIGWMFTTTYMGPYQPLAWLSYAIDNQIWGLKPAPFHATNIALHAATAVIFFLLARRLLNKATSAPGVTLDLLAALAALLFSVHPLRVESVAWITERRDVLCGVFFMGALLAYTGTAEARSDERGNNAVSPACIFLTILAALSKGWAMSLPGLMLVMDYFPLRRWPGKPWKSLILEKLPLIAIAAMTAMIAYIGQRSGAWGPQQFAQRSIAERAAQASYALLYYPAKTLWPTRLLPIYELPDTLHATDPIFLSAILGAITITLALWLLRKRFPAGLAAWLAYAVTIAPFLGLAHAGNQIVADRYSYLSCLAFPLLAAGCLAAILRRPTSSTTRAAILATSIVVIAILASQTWALTTAWQTSLALWQRAIAINPNSWVARSNLADALRKSGDNAAARSQFEEAVRINPKAGIAWQNLGELLKAEKRFPEAEAALNHAARYHPEPAQAELQLGEICARTGRPDEALNHFAIAARTPRTAAWAEFGMGVVFRSARRTNEAIDHLQRAAQLDSTIPGLIQELEAARALSTRPVYPTSSGPYKQNG